MKSIKKLGLMGLLGAAIVTLFLIAQTPADPMLNLFPVVPGWDDVESAAKFRIWVLDSYNGYFANSEAQAWGLYTPSSGPGTYGVLTSPLLYEPSTIIGLSARHQNGPGIDQAGAFVGTGADQQVIAENLFTAKPANFDKGRRWEVHTMVGLMDISPLDPGTYGNFPRVRAGSNSGGIGQLSPGEVESDNNPMPPTNDFPGHSCFNIRARIDLPALNGDVPFPGCELYTVDPLLIQATGLDTFPPTVVYTHAERFGLPPAVYFVNDGPGGEWQAGDQLGFITMAGHGMGFGPGPPYLRDDIAIFEAIMDTLSDMEPLPTHDCPWPEEEGYDTIPFNIFKQGFYLPDDTNNLIGVLVSGGENVVVRRGPYNAVLGYMPTEVVELHGCGKHVPILGGSFQISLASNPPSEGYIAPCDATCEMAYSWVNVYYEISTPLFGTIAGESGEMELMNACDEGTGYSPMSTGSWEPPAGFGYEYVNPQKTPIYDPFGNLIGYIWHEHEMYNYGVHDLIFHGSRLTFGWYQDGVPWEDEWFYGYRLLNSEEIAYESHVGLLDFREKHPEFDNEDVDFTFLCPAGANGWRQIIEQANGVSDVYAYNIDVNGPVGQWQIPDLIPEETGPFDTIFTAVNFATYSLTNPNGFSDGEWGEGQTLSELDVVIIDGQAENCEGIYWAESEFEVGGNKDEAPVPTGGLKDLLNSVTYPSDIEIAALHSNQGFGPLDCCVNPGDANSDGNANVGDVVFIINFVFKSGPAPNCDNQADANADCNVDVGDAVHMINHIFKDGDAPVCGCVE